MLAPLPRALRVELERMWLLRTQDLAVGERCGKLRLQGQGEAVCTELGGLPGGNGLV